MDQDIKKYVYSQPSIEFMTVAVQYCILMEGSFEGMTCDRMTGQLTKLLPLLYLKASLVSSGEFAEDDAPEMAVTEEIYNYIASRLAQLYGTDDTYLEVFVQDMKYSETPIAESISENLADIYQDLKNCAAVYERGIEEAMNDALLVCIENFGAYWGQKLVNVLRALHWLKYQGAEREDDAATGSGSDNYEIW